MEILRRTENENSIATIEYLSINNVTSSNDNMPICMESSRLQVCDVMDSKSNLCISKEDPLCKFTNAEEDNNHCPEEASKVVEDNDYYQGEVTKRMEKDVSNVMVKEKPFFIPNEKMLIDMGLYEWLEEDDELCDCMEIECNGCFETCKECGSTKCNLNCKISDSIKVISEI
ncbi:PREDICTED: uncharacterized protein LOC108564997 [Nicrophorus vespilloides]|uniref:Uncharacterized protein LOC108564997 n=1 Tax=Nicrophorus vespilloides TaxID=110193 RepID=A0ABM1MYQ7_NICVS|nr:PREDICTED: uncharacterized protein LOC108564997 [Nicrophorus vespilloides]